MSTTIELIFAGMIALTPEKYRPLPDSPKMATYESYASDFEASVTSTPIEALPFSGPASIEATESALEAVAANESSYQQDVRDCTKKGDSGKSISPYQLYRGTSRQGHSEKEICGDPVLAGRLAVNILHWYSWVPTVDRMFAGYARGTTTEPNFASQTQTKSFNKLIQMRGIRVYRKKGAHGFYAEFLPQSVVASSGVPSASPPVLPD